MDSMFKGTLDWGEGNTIEECEASADVANEESMYCLRKVYVQKQPVRV